MTPTWKLQTFSIDSLKGINKNPRRLTKEQHSQLKRSLSKFGLIDKPVVTPDGIIIGGHQRIRILDSIGETEVECNVTDYEFNEKDIEELNIRLNKNTGEWDDDILANEWDDDDLIEYGFTAKDLGIDADSVLNDALEEDKPKKAVVTITFDNVLDMDKASDQIETIVNKYSNATYKVKVK